MRPTRVFALLLVCFTTAFAQKAVRFDPFRSLAPYKSASTPQAVADTVRLLGVLVEFKVDTDSRTTGDGRFDSTDTNPAIVDPPPHDAAFFQSKMRFVENYFWSVSNKKSTVVGDVLPIPVTLNRTMVEYAAISVPAFGGLSQLARDSWLKADSVYPGTNFAAYDAFVVFHAGTGKDIDLVGILGFDPSPYDLPSVYLSLEAMRKGLDSAAFNGVAVSGGTFRITNTMILPETEMRVFTSSSGVEDTLELSINGLFAASVGSHLGLPDLFDTKTGRSGIGQYGLMDGASIFAYQGLCPPEPSAWEKVHLGWVTPIDVEGTIDTITIPAVGLTASEDSIYRVRVNASEYYLIENRIRDPLGNGQQLTIYRNGTTTILRVPTDSTGFYTFDVVNGIDGSVLDVEDPDWSLIGRFGIENRFDGGGILIWHIDEDRVTAGLVDNTVNADPDRRGIDLEEADGSQDLGESYEFLSGGSGSESGSPLDAWFAGNEARPYTNRFDDASFPNSRTNAGASSLVSIRDFSSRANRMTAVVERGTVRAVPLNGFPKQLAGHIGPALTYDIDDDGQTEFISSRVLTTGPNGRNGVDSGNGAILVWRQNGQGYLNSADSIGVAAVSDSAVIGTPAIAPHPQGGPPIVAAASPGVLNIWRAQDIDAVPFWDKVGTIALPIYAVPFWDIVGTIALPAVTVVWNVLIDDTLIVAYGPAGIVVATIGGTLVNSFTPGPTTDMAWSGSTGNYVFGVGTELNRLHISPGGRSLDAISSVRSVGGTISSVVAGMFDATVSGVVVQSVGEAGASRITVLRTPGWQFVSTTDVAISLREGETVLSPLSLVDMDRDGRTDVAMPTSTGRILVLNTDGVQLDRSPRPALVGRNWTSAEVLAADLGGDATPELLAFDDRGVLSIASSSHTAGFQVANSARTSAAIGPIQVPLGSGTSLFVTDEAGGVSAFDLKATWNGPGAVWRMRRGNAGGTSYSSVVTASPVAVSAGVLPADRVYNWPNPVYGSETRIRFFTEFDGAATVTIFDIAGDRITTLNGVATGGRDNEIVWDVSGIQSGIYLAKVEVKGSGGSGEAVIKVAVVK